MLTSSRTSSPSTTDDLEQQTPTKKRRIIPEFLPEKTKKPKKPNIPYFPRRSYGKGQAFKSKYAYDKALAAYAKKWSTRPAGTQGKNAVRF